MGLFSKNKKLCPLCGNPVSWFLPIKWKDQPLCDDCGCKLADLSGDIRTRVEESEESIREYFAAYDENMALRSSFQETYKHEFGLILGGCVSMDVPQRLLRLSASDNAFVYEGQYIVSFRITEDDAPLFEGTRDEFICYESDIPARVENMRTELERFERELRHYEHIRRMEEHREREARARGEEYIADYIPSPSVSDLNPFKKYHVYIELEHPYKKEAKEYKQDGPGFSEYNLTVESYMSGYENYTADIRTLAENLMAVMNPDAPLRVVPSANSAASRSMPAAVADPVEEIKKYKSLLDCGAITEEEFAAKKRQLMGI